MIFLYLVAALAALITFVFGILPDATFFPMPSEATGAVRYIGSVIGWGIGLAGDDIKAAIITMLPIVIGVNLTLYLWQILKSWRPPVVGKFL